MKFTNWMFASMWLGASAAAAVGVAITGQPDCLWALAAPTLVSIHAMFEGGW